MKPDFKNINILNTGTKQASGCNQMDIAKDWMTPEQIPVKPVYTKEDLEGWNI